MPRRGTTTSRRRNPRIRFRERSTLISGRSACREAGRGSTSKPTGVGSMRRMKNSAATGWSQSGSASSFGGSTRNRSSWPAVSTGHTSRGSSRRNTSTSTRSMKFSFHRAIAKTISTTCRQREDGEAQTATSPTFANTNNGNTAYRDTWRRSRLPMRWSVA